MRALLPGKPVAIGAIVLLLLFGLRLIGDVVQDRLLHRDTARRSIAQSLAGSQALLGPLMVSHCVETWETRIASDKEAARTPQRREFTLAAVPDDLQFTTSVLMEPRARGLHKVNTYLLKARALARWDSLAALRAAPTTRDGRVQCDAPVLMLAVGDARGIRTARLVVDGEARPLRSGTTHAPYARGVHAVLPESLRGRDSALRAEFDLELAGTERLSVVPLAGQTALRMTSAWPHPSFDGRFLPTERTVSPLGFDAQWRLSALATTAPQDVLAGKGLCADGVADEGDNRRGCADAFGVSFVDPVNPYSLSDRATKYGLLFVVLTFVAVGLLEFLRNLRVHPVQYLLVGSALSIFFLLLLSLSEHLSFGWAYAAAAAACVALLAFYASHVLGGLGRGLPFGAGIAVLYGTLYLLLQLEQTALVVGAMALFAVLATIMVLTRRVDWYARLAPRAAESPTAAPSAPATHPAAP